jgi:hypothetical protein
MNPFLNEFILAEKKINMLPNMEKSSSNTVNFSKNIGNTNVKYPSSDKRLSLTKAYSCSDAISSNLNEQCSFITVRQFADLVGHKHIPIVDCRSQIDYGCERIRTSFNINCRAKLLAKKLITKRLEDIEPGLAISINNSEMIILYDQSTDARDEEKIRSLPINLVLQAAKRSNKKVFIIQGGFDAVKHQFPNLIECAVEIPREKHDQDYLPSTPDTMDKENFVMTEILPRIFVGNIHDAQNLERLNQNGITHIINATPDLPLFWENQYQYLRIGVLDLPSESIRKHFDKAFQFIDEKLQNKTNKILVHCSAGISRSPTLVLAYMIKKYQMKFDEAFNKMRQLRQIVDPNVSFILQLRDWETKCLSTINETNEELSCNNNSRSTSSTYCGSTSKSKIDVKSHPDAPITVN